MSKNQRFGQRKLAVIRSDVGSFCVPSFSYCVRDISRSNIPSAQGTVLSDVFRSYDDARSALEALLGHELPQQTGMGWSKGKCAWLEGRRRGV